jgi:hypothetical protein
MDIKSAISTFRIFRRMPTLSLGSLGIPFNVTIEKATPKKWTPDLIKRFISVRERVFTAQAKQLKEYFKADSDVEAKIFNMNNVLTNQVLTERKDAMAKEIAEAMAEHFQMPVDNGDWYEISWRIQKPDWTSPSLRRAELSIRMVALREGLPVLIPGDKTPVVEFDYEDKNRSAPKPSGPPQGPSDMPGDSYDQNSNLGSGSSHAGTIDTSPPSENSCAAVTVTVEPDHTYDPPPSLTQNTV